MRWLFLMGLLLWAGEERTVEKALHDFYARPEVREKKLARVEARHVKGVVESYVPWMTERDRELARRILGGAFPSDAQFRLDDEGGVPTIFLSLKSSRFSVVHGRSLVQAYNPEVYCKTVRCVEPVVGVSLVDKKAPKMRFVKKQLRVPESNFNLSKDLKKKKTVSVYDVFVAGDRPNLETAFAYFGKQRPALMKQERKWVPLSEFLPPNPARLLNHFPPKELTGNWKGEVRSPNCYSSVRNFFFPDMEPFSGEANSLASFHAFLKKSYCPVKPRTLRFADVIVHKDHAVRFLAYDEQFRAWVFEKRSGSLLDPWRVAQLQNVFPSQEEVSVYRRCSKEQRPSSSQPAGASVLN